MGCQTGKTAGAAAQFVLFAMTHFLRDLKPSWDEAKACLGLAVPLAGAQLSQADTAFTDTVMTGLLGSQYLAAGGLAATTFTSLLLMSTGVVSAVSPLAAEAQGAGRIEKAGRVAVQGLWLSALMALPIMLLVWYMGPILRQLGQEEATVVLAESYLRAIVWGFFPALAFASLKNFASALSRPRPVMILMVLGMGLNVVANYALIFGKLGLPALQLAGVGWASTMAYWFMFLALMAYIAAHSSFRPYQVLSRLHRWEGGLFLDVVKMGWPIGVLFGVETGLFTVTTFLMGQLGTVTLAAHQIVLQTAAVTFMVPVGISLATTVRVGQFMGQQNWRAARRAGYIGIGIGGLFMGGMALLFWTVPQAIIGLYLDMQNPANAQVIQVATALLGVAAMFQLVDGIQIVAAGALRGLKDTRIPMVIGIFAYWGIGMSSGYVLGLHLGWGGVGLWLGLAFGLSTAATTLTWRFARLMTPALEVQPLNR